MSTANISVVKHVEDHLLESLLMLPLHRKDEAVGTRCSSDLSEKAQTLLKRINPTCDENSSFKFYHLLVECIFQWSFLHPTSKTDPRHPSLYQKGADYLVANNIKRDERLGFSLYQDPLVKTVFIKTKEQTSAAPNPSSEVKDATSSLPLDPKLKPVVREGIRRMRANASEFMGVINSNKSISVSEANDLFNRTITLYNYFKADFNQVLGSSDPAFEKEKKMVQNERFLINNAHVLFGKYKGAQLKDFEFTNGVGDLYQTYLAKIGTERLEPESPVPENLKKLAEAKAQDKMMSDFFSEPSKPVVQEPNLQASVDFFNFDNVPKATNQTLSHQDVFSSFGFPPTAPEPIAIKGDPPIERKKSTQSHAEKSSVRSIQEVRDPIDRHLVISEVVRSGPAGEFEKREPVPDPGSRLGDPSFSIPSHLRTSVEKVAAARSNLFASQGEMDASQHGHRASGAQSQHSRASVSQHGNRQANNVKITMKKAPQVIVNQPAFDDHMSHSNKSGWFDPVPDLSKVLEDGNNSLISKKPANLSKFGNKTEEFFSVRSGGEGKMDLHHNEHSIISPRLENSLSMTPDKVLLGLNNQAGHQPAKKFTFEEPKDEPIQAADNTNSPYVFKEELLIDHHAHPLPVVGQPADPRPDLKKEISEENLLRVPVSHHQMERKGSGEKDVSFSGGKDKDEHLPAPNPVLFEESVVVQGLKQKVIFLETEIANKNYDAWALNTRHEQEVETLRKAIADLKMENLEIKKQAASLESFDQDLHQQLASLLQENAAISLELSKASNENVLLKQQFDSLRRESTEKIKQQNQSIQVAESAYRQLFQESRELSAANSRMVARLAAVKTSGSETHGLEADILALKSELNKARADLNQAQVLNISYEHLGKDQDAYYRACQEQVEKAKAQFDAHVQELTEAHDKERIRTAELHQSELKKLIHQVKDLERQLVNQSTLNIQKNNLAYLSPNHHQSSLDLSGHKRFLLNDPVHQHSLTQIEQLEAELRKAKQEQIKNEVDISYFKEDIMTKTKELDEAQTMIERLNKDLKAVKDENLHQLQLFFTKEKGYQEIQIKFNELMKKYTGLLKTLETKEHEEAVLRKELNDYHTRMIRISDKHSAEIESIIKNPVRDLEVQRLKEINEINEKKVTELIGTNLQLKQRLIELETDLELQIQAKSYEKNTLKQLEVEVTALKEELFMKKKRILDLEEKVLEADVSHGQSRMLRQEIHFYKFVLQEVLGKNGSLNLGELTPEIERLIHAPVPVYSEKERKRDQSYSLNDRSYHDAYPGPSSILPHLEPQAWSSKEVSVHAPAPESTIERPPEQSDPESKYQSVWSRLPLLTTAEQDTPAIHETDKDPDSPRFAAMQQTATHQKDSELAPAVPENQVYDKAPMTETTAPTFETKNFKVILQRLCYTDELLELTKEVCLNRSGLFFKNEVFNLFLEASNFDPKSRKTTLHIRFVTASPMTITKVFFDNYGRYS